MKKIAIIILLAALVATLTACSDSNNFSSNPLVAKWTRIYNDGASKVLFNFSDIGDLQVVVWHKNAEGELAQESNSVGTYVQNVENSTIAYELDGRTYVFSYAVEAKTALTLIYEGVEYRFDFAGANIAIETE